MPKDEATAPAPGYAYLHTVLDDHSRPAYTEDLPDETAPTCAGFLTRATAWFAAQGITVERVLTDNAWACSRNVWRQTCHQLGISPPPPPLDTPLAAPDQRQGRTLPPHPARGRSHRCFRSFAPP